MRCMETAVIFGLCLAIGLVRGEDVAEIVDDSAAAAAAANSSDPAKEGKGHGYGYGGYPAPNYYPSYGPPIYEPPFEPYFDTHYCSVHGSFALTFSELVPGSEGGTQYTAPQPKRNRKFIREYCRFAAASSDQACSFCCKVVAHSAFTNKDDIISAVFAFDPANPTGGNAGVAVAVPSPWIGYGPPPSPYGLPPPPNGYGIPPPPPFGVPLPPNGYGTPAPGPYGAPPPPPNGYGAPPPPPNGYGAPPPPPNGYGAPQPPNAGYGQVYRQKRQSAAPPAAPTDSYPVDSTPPSNVPVDSYNPINQCLCCAPKY